MCPLLKKNSNAIILVSTQFVICVEIKERKKFMEMIFLERKIRKKQSNRKGVLSIVYSNKNKRLVIAKQVEKDLNITDKVQIAITKDNQIIISKEIDKSKEYYSLLREKKNDEKSKLILYDAELISYIVEKFALDYSSRTSYTFYDILYKEHNHNICAIVGGAS